MFNRNDMLVGGIRPHLYCLPILKRNIHQQALRELVASGFTRAFPRDGFSAAFTSS